MATLPLPSKVYKTETPNAGNGLFVSQEIEAGAELFHIERPLVTVLDQNHLTTACSNCFCWVPESDADAAPVQQGEDGNAKKKLRACQGCKIVRYCSKDCQAASWNLHHKFECKIFSKLYPNVLPNTVRIVLQILLRRKSSTLPDLDWQSFLTLESHSDSFRSSPTQNSEGLTTWQTIELMSQAASSYSGSKDPLPFIQTLTARLLVNTLTLTTPTFDPLGLTLCTTTSLLNHSCTPNVAITFSGPRLTVRALTPIAKDTELAISYIDTTNATPARQSELQSRYFFTCACPACSAGTTNGKPDPPEDTTWKAISTRAIESQSKAATLAPNQAASLLKEAVGLFNPYPPDRQPHPAILHTAFLNALARQDWPTALSYSLKAYFYIDPIHYQPSWHPVRIVRKWVLLRLVAQIAGLVHEKDPSAAALEKKYDINWQVFAMSLMKDIFDGLPKSHGEGSGFAKQVMAFAEDSGMVGKEVGEEDIAKELGKLRRIADVGVKEAKLLE